MSTKFSGIPKTQKPPAVCRKPPPPLPVPLPPIEERTLRAYVEWYDPEGSDAVVMADYISMRPAPWPATWSGRTDAGPYYVILVASDLKPINAYHYQISLALGLSLVDTYEVPLLSPRSLEPFDSGLITFETGQQNKRVQARVVL
jgi:hypothetical protein